MHHMPNESKSPDALETTGITIHWAHPYDLFGRLAGMGETGRNSRMVIELAQIEPGDCVLDVACGTGSLTMTARAAAGPSGKVYGIDASPEMIEFAQDKAKRAATGVVFAVGLIENLDFPDGTFDVVISRLAIHHLPDDLKVRAFAEILRVLKPGGRLLIADFMQPSNHVFNHLAGVLVGPTMMQAQVWRLPAMVESAGFVEVASGPTRSRFLAFVSGKKPGR